jgi:hypothetical protein
MCSATRAAVSSLLSCTVALTCLTSAGIDAQERRVAAQPFVLTGQVIGERFCEGDGELSTQFLTMRLTLQNTSSASITVPLLSSIAGDLTVAASETDLKAGRIESRSDPEIISADGSIPRQPRRFMVLGPNEKRVLPFSVRIVVGVKTAESPLSGIPGPGEHVLSFEWYPWRLGPEAGAQWVKAQRVPGTVWFEPVRAEPVRFSVPVRPRFDNCG